MRKKYSVCHYDETGIRWFETFEKIGMFLEPPTSKPDPGSGR
jgi:hypothetical protein